jgi:hypothetical protein
VRVEASNLNYLCYGPCPVYVLYRSRPNELRFVWARQEAERLDRLKPDWRNQQQVSLRFYRRLDALSFDEIHVRILQEGQLGRQIYDIIARSTVSEHVTIQITPSTLQVSDPNQIERLLIDSGMTIVASGFARRAVELYEALNPTAKSRPKILLVHAYAQYLLDDYFAAQSSLARAATKLDELSDSERCWHERMRRICDYRIGRIDREEYLRQQQEASERLTGVPALEHRLEVTRHRQLAARDLRQRQELKESIGQIVAEIRDHPDAPPGLRIAARICELSAEGQDCVVQSVHNNHLANMRGQIGTLSDNFRRHVELLEGRWRAWSENMQRVYNEAADANHPMLIADALYAAGSVRHLACMTERVFSEIDGRRAPDANERIRTAIGFLEQSQDIYAGAGCMESELRAKMLRADLYEILGEQETARRLASEVLPIAAAMQYATIETNARDHIEGLTLLRQYVDRLREVKEADEDLKLAAASEADLDQLARDAIEVAGLSNERVGAMRRYHETRRTIARERLDWCRHIDFEADFSATPSIESLLAQDPMQFCVCRELGYRSAVPHTDCGVVLRAFKETYCKACDRREPKRETASPLH